MAKRKKETLILSKICNELRTKGELSSKESLNSVKLFRKRYDDAINLVDENCIKKYIFKPSRRILWVVEGRKKEYQIFPETNFCSCDDYYFRVMKFEKDLCYHLIAQKIAEALSKYQKMEMSDSDYASITKKFRPEREV
jgi:predicted nucleic acid-binding Zn finger protein